VRRAAAAVGVAFGFLLSWGQATSPDRIRDMLLLRDPYLFLMLGSGVVVASAGVRLLRRARRHAIVTGEPIAWETLRPERRHVVGSVLFGAGWAVSDACPGPILAQLGQGFAWSVFTLAGVVAGVWLYLRREERLAPAPARTPRAGADVARAME
jgi:uncharacterized membrane protein YedE/YeeE